jgi:hypothetical protein
MERYIPHQFRVKCQCVNALKCGYVDSPVWRNVRYRIYTMYCRIDDLTDWEIELYAMLIAKVKNGDFKDFIIGRYIYHIVKGGTIVQRIHINDSRDGKTHREPEQEKLMNYRIVNRAQKKLVFTN